MTPETTGGNTWSVSREPFPQSGEHLADGSGETPRRLDHDDQASASEPKRFIGGIAWGTWPLMWRATWPLAELIVTSGEVVVRPRRIVKFLCPPGARYSIA